VHAIRKTILQTVSATRGRYNRNRVKISPEVAVKLSSCRYDGMPIKKKGELLVKVKPDSYKPVEQQEAASRGEGNQSAAERR